MAAAGRPGRSAVAVGEGVAEQLGDAAAGGAVLEPLQDPGRRGAAGAVSAAGPDFDYGDGFLEAHERPYEQKRAGRERPAAVVS